MANMNRKQAVPCMLNMQNGQANPARQSRTSISVHSRKQSRHDQACNNHNKVEQSCQDMFAFDSFEADADLIILNDEIVRLNYTENSKVEDEQTDPVSEIVIGCRLSNGVVIRIKGQSILLRGIEDMPGHRGLDIYKTRVGFTRLPRSIWDEFLKIHPDWSLLKDGSVFVSRKM